MMPLVSCHLGRLCPTTNKTSYLQGTINSIQIRQSTCKIFLRFRQPERLVAKPDSQALTTVAHFAATAPTVPSSWPEDHRPPERPSTERRCMFKDECTMLCNKTNLYPYLLRSTYMDSIPINKHTVSNSISAPRVCNARFDDESLRWSKVSSLQRENSERALSPRRTSGITKYIGEYIG